MTLPAFAYFLSRQKRQIQSQLIIFLDELAKGLQLIKIPSSQTIEPPAATPAAALAATPATKTKPAPMRVELPKPPEAVTPAESKSPAV